MISALPVKYALRVLWIAIFMIVAPNLFFVFGAPFAARMFGALYAAFFGVVFSVIIFGIGYDGTHVEEFDPATGTNRTRPITAADLPAGYNAWSRGGAE